MRSGTKGGTPCIRVLEYMRASVILSCMCIGPVITLSPHVIVYVHKSVAGAPMMWYIVRTYTSDYPGVMYVRDLLAGFYYWDLKPFLRNRWGAADELCVLYPVTPNTKYQISLAIRKLPHTRRKSPNHNCLCDTFY